MTPEELAVIEMDRAMVAAYAHELGEAPGRLATVHVPALLLALKREQDAVESLKVALRRALEVAAAEQAARHADRKLVEEDHSPDMSPEAWHRYVAALEAAGAAGEALRALGVSP